MAKQTSATPSASVGVVTPSKDDYRRLARADDHVLIPVYREIIADTETPVSTLLKIGRKNTYSYILESVEGGERVGRYSFIGCGASRVFQSRGNRVRIGEAAEKDGSYTWEERRVDNPLNVLRALLSEYKPAHVTGLPRFYGGAVGYFGYEMVQSIWDVEPPTQNDVLDLPDSCLIISDVVVIFDHVQGTMKLVANTRPGTDPDRAYDEAVQRLDAVLETLRRHEPVTPLDVSDRNVEPAVTYASNYNQTDFETAVRQVQEHIRDGQVSQAVVSQRFTAPITVSPATLYRVLRTINPSPYMYYLHFDDTAIVGSSPEVMARLEDGIAYLRPIAGTRPRGNTAEEDRQYEEDLLADAKERAEHLMLVESSEEDLAGLCEPGSIEVRDFMRVERYSHVMHIVSDVAGKLAADYDALDLFQATFPAGTVCGAPRKKAIEIIGDIEGERRGPYSGAIGYFGYSGNMDTCITIRTAVIKDGTAHIQAGAGIVKQSVPADEYEETLNKARAMLKAIAMAEQVPSAEGFRE